MYLWYDSWEQIKDLLTEKIRAGMSFEEAMNDIIENNSELHAIFFRTVKSDNAGFVKNTFFIAKGR